MPAWLIPALKAVLPHIGTIVSVALPAFTQKKTGSTENQVALLQQQVAELQAAASQNAAHVRDLAGQLQLTVTALEQAAVMTRRTTLLCVIAVTVSAIALIVTLFPALLP